MANIESAQALKLEGLRVLIVEDEALVAFQLEDMLADLGCAIIGPASRVGWPDHAVSPPARLAEALPSE